MKVLSLDELLDLTSINSVEEFLVKKDLLNKKTFNAHDSYDLIAVFCAQHKDSIAEKLTKDYKIFKLGFYFINRNKMEQQGGRQKYINEAMKKFALYAQNNDFAHP